MTSPDPVADVWELLWTAACDYRDAAGPDRSEARLIDALMPIVRAYAAGELRAAKGAILDQAATQWDPEGHVFATQAGYILHRRADEIAAEPQS